MVVAATSLAAYDRLDLTAGQQQVMALFWSHGETFGATRWEIHELTKMPYEGVCGRVFELINDEHLLTDQDTGKRAHKKIVRLATISALPNGNSRPNPPPCYSHDMGRAHSGSALLTTNAAGRANRISGESDRNVSVPSTPHAAPPAPSASVRNNATTAPAGTATRHTQRGLSVVSPTRCGVMRPEAAASDSGALCVAVAATGDERACPSPTVAAAGPHTAAAPERAYSDGGTVKRPPTRVIYTTTRDDGTIERKVIESKRDCWELVDAARQFFHPDIHPDMREAAYLAALKVRDAK